MIPENLVGQLLTYSRRTTDPRGEPMDLALAEAFMQANIADHAVSSAWRDSIGRTLSIKPAVEAFYKGISAGYHSSIDQSVAVLGRLQADPKIRLLYMFNRSQDLWVAFYTPFDWAEAQEQGELSLGNVRRNLTLEGILDGLATLPLMVREALRGRSLYWASPIEAAPTGDAIPPVMAMTLESATRGIRINSLYPEVVRVVGGRRDFQAVEPYVQTIRKGLVNSIGEIIC